MSEPEVVWCESCQLGGLYVTHDCERVQADSQAIRASVFAGQGRWI